MIFNKSVNSELDSRGTKMLPGKQYTSNQLFWITFSGMWCTRFDELTLRYLEVIGWKAIHSPPPVRINGVLQNSEEFSKDFNCPRGSKMNPMNKCGRIW